MRTEKVREPLSCAKAFIIKVVWGLLGVPIAESPLLCTCAHLSSMSPTVFGMQNNLAPSSAALSHGTASTSTGQ